MNNGGEGQDVAQRNGKVPGYHEGNNGVNVVFSNLSKIWPQKTGETASDLYKFKGTIDSIDCYVKLQF